MFECVSVSGSSSIIIKCHQTTSPPSLSASTSVPVSSEQSTTESTVHITVEALEAISKHLEVVRNHSLSIVSRILINLLRKEFYPLLWGWEGIEIYRQVDEISKKIDKIQELLERKKRIIGDQFRAYTSDVLEQMEIKLTGKKMEKTSSRCSSDESVSADDYNQESEVNYDLNENFKSVSSSSSWTSTTLTKTATMLNNEEEFLKEINEID
ncbi:hypothetical protein SSS_09078 [Sarcoptes scabiei]|uniref:Uncharacterized protein n=1 Tax=Sarcoptes scabiei TaxID=52283 RepID=A0A834RB01_SARSC|nr:hypothetical protein SSS_09078 [Sarcoptes scabiei]